MIDSGCTNHMTGDSKLLYDFLEAIQPFMSIMFGGGSKGQVLGLGKVAITNDMSLANVMLVQSLKYHLLSVRQLASVGYDTLFGLTDVKVFKRDTLEVAFVGELDGKWYLRDWTSMTFARDMSFVIATLPNPSTYPFEPPPNIMLMNG